MATNGRMRRRPPRRCAAAAGSGGRTSPGRSGPSRYAHGDHRNRSADRGRTLETCAALRDGPGVSATAPGAATASFDPARDAATAGPANQAGDRCRGLRSPQGAAGQRRRAHRLVLTIARIAPMRSSVDVLVGMNGDDTPRVFPAGVQGAKVKEEQRGLAASGGVALVHAGPAGALPPEPRPAGPRPENAPGRPRTHAQHALCDGADDPRNPPSFAGRRHGHR